MFEKTFKQMQRAALGKMLVRKELISQAELDQALAFQPGSNKKLGQLLVEKNLISQDKIDQVLVEQHIMLGQLLIQEKSISQAELDQVLAFQPDSNKKLGQMLVEKNLISQDKLEKTLKKQYWQKNGLWLISWLAFPIAEVLRLRFSTWL